jgi:hypothetical protein
MFCLQDIKCKKDKFLYIPENTVAESLLEEEELDRTMWRTSFGRSYGLVIRQATKWINE